jgi:hypothetical protein
MLWNGFDPGIYSIASMQNKCNADAEEKMDTLASEYFGITGCGGGIKELKCIFISSFFQSECYRSHTGYFTTPSVARIYRVILNYCRGFRGL